MPGRSHDGSPDRAWSAHSAHPVHPAHPAHPVRTVGATDAATEAHSVTYSFNLVDEPWIPVLRSAHTSPELLNLRQVLSEAPRLWQLADPSPVVTISLYRLLLAILHRSLRGPRTSAEWARIAGIAGYGAGYRAGRGAGPVASSGGAWGREEQEAIDSYLTTWRGRFDLFDPRYPFYQTPDLPVSARTGPATVLAQERASPRNQPLLFDHTTSDRAWLTPDAAARALLVQQNFAVGGLISYDTLREPIANKYVGMAPLLGAAICLVRGATLFETLMLNWVAYNPTEAQPFPFWGDDRPAWERDEPTAPSERRPNGYVDLLTWQSRRILLVPTLLPASVNASVDASVDASGGAREQAGSGERLVVARAVLMKGYQFSPSFERWTAETMLPFRKSARSSSGAASAPASASGDGAGAGAGETTGGESGPESQGNTRMWYGFSLQPDRVVWRDSPALLQSAPGVQTRPKTLDWLSELVRSGWLDSQRTLPLEVYGMIPDQANILEWRRESLPLPLALLRDDTLLDHVGQAVALAESVSRVLLPGAVKLVVDGQPAVTTGSPVSLLAEALLVSSSDRPPDRRAREDLVSSFGASLPFWAHLETPFRQFLTSLAQAAEAHDPEHDEEGMLQSTLQSATQSATHSARQAALQSAMEVWAHQVERAVRQVFGQTIADLDTSARTLRAATFARSRFAFCMNALLAPWRAAAPSPAASISEMTSTPADTLSLASSSVPDGSSVLSGSSGSGDAQP